MKELHRGVNAGDDDESSLLPDDVLGCAFDQSSGAPTLRFYKNGIELPGAVIDGGPRGTLVVGVHVAPPAAVGIPPPLNLRHFVPSLHNLLQGWLPSEFTSELRRRSERPPKIKVVGVVPMIVFQQGSH